MWHGNGEEISIKNLNSKKFTSLPPKWRKKQSETIASLKGKVTGENGKHKRT